MKLHTRHSRLDVLTAIDFAEPVFPSFGIIAGIGMAPDIPKG